MPVIKWSTAARAHVHNASCILGMARRVQICCLIRDILATGFLQNGGLSYIPLTNISVMGRAIVLKRTRTTSFFFVSEAADPRH